MRFIVLVHDALGHGCVCYSAPERCLKRVFIPLCSSSFLHLSLCCEYSEIFVLLSQDMLRFAYIFLPQRQLLSFIRYLVRGAEFVCNVLRLDFLNFVTSLLSTKGVLSCLSVYVAVSHCSVHDYFQTFLPSCFIHVFVSVFVLAVIAFALCLESRTQAASCSRGGDFIDFVHLNCFVALLFLVSFI